jgi:Transcriptional Coactivator p15 (PC4)
MAKLIKVSPTKAYRMEGVEIKGERYVSIRQMYATKNDPQYKHGKQGLNIPIENAEKIAKYLKAIAEGDEFVELELNKD